MTANADIVPAETHYCGSRMMRESRHDTTNHNELNVPLSRRKDNRDDLCNDTQIEDWEDEGGTHFNRPDGVFRDSRVTTKSDLSAHMDAAEALMIVGNYDDAFAELEAAADRFMTYKLRINRSFDTSIAKLSTLGCRASPPHPKALHLIKLRQQIIT